MNNQSSTQKGDSLERKAYELLKELLANDDFFVNGKKSKIFWKKAYFSEKRKGNIIFDVTIETYLDNADTYSILTIVECKNLGRKVTVDDIEEFNSKISEIGEHNTKGIVVSSSLFQEGAYNYAKSQKIGLVKISSNDKFDWINYRKANPVGNIAKNISSQFLNETENSPKFIASANDKEFTNFADLLIEYKIIDFYVHNESFIKIPFVSDERIDEIVERLNKHNIYKGLCLDTDKLCTLLSEVYPVTFDFESNLPSELLGKIEFDPLKITIASSLKSDINRWRFTLAHEIGHLILHYKLLKDSINEKTDNENTLSFGHYVTEAANKKLELQANIFASHLLLPDAPIKSIVNNYFVSENIYKGFLFLDFQQVNQRLVFTLLNKVSEEFQVSAEVVKIRLLALDLLQDTTDMSLKRFFKKRNIRY